MDLCALLCLVQGGIDRQLLYCFSCPEKEKKEKHVSDDDEARFSGGACVCVSVQLFLVRSRFRSAKALPMMR